MNKTIDHIIRNELKLGAEIKKIEKLHGDASYRTYSRIYLSNGRTFIMMQMPKGKSSASEEITNYEGEHRELPFINMDRYLKDIGLNVPDIQRYDDDDRIMILEDLGDDLMSKIVDGLDAEKLGKHYEKAVDLLVDIQRRSDGNRSDSCIAFKRSFDAKLLNWEFDHFLEYGLEAQGAKIPQKDLDEFKRQTRSITQKIEGMKYGLTLRDFQSRNIIMKDGLHYIIDFQDALMGPKLYDLVSLLRDSYIELDYSLVFRLVDYYASKVGRNSSEARKEFDLITIQRKMKDAGRFVYIDKVKGNSSYLKYISTSLQYITSALERISEYESLLNILIKYKTNPRG